MPGSPVQITGAVWPTHLKAKLGPYRAKGKWWVFAFDSTPHPVAYNSIDAGATWSAATGSSITCTIDSMWTQWDGNDTVYVLIQDASHVIHMYSFTLSTSTWNAEIFSSGTRPTALADVSAAFPGMFVRRSTGEFVVYYQGPLHTSTFRTPQYQRLSAAGVWSAGVQVFSTSSVHGSCKDINVDTSSGNLDRVYFYYAHSSSSASYKDISSGNVLSASQDWAGGGAGATEPMTYGAISDPVLGKNIVGPKAGSGNVNNMARFPLGTIQTITADTNAIGTGAPAKFGTAPPFCVHDGTYIHVFYVDNTTRDIFHNQLVNSSTTWTAANAAVVDTATAATAVCGELMGDVIAWVYRDTNVFFDFLYVGPPKAPVVINQAVMRAATR